MTYIIQKKPALDVFIAHDQTIIVLIEKKCY